MAVASTPSAADPPVLQPPPPVSMSFDITQPPVIEGFTPTLRRDNETFKDRFLVKFKQNPFVPIGCLGTAAVLAFGLRSFQQGNTRNSQMLMRGRIFAQGFTVAALVFGVVVTALKSKD